MPTILVVAEKMGGVVQPATYEIFTLATRLGGRVIALITDSQPPEKEYVVPGLETIFVVQTPHSPDVKAAVIARVAQNQDVDMVFMAATAAGKDCMGRVAAHLKVSLLQDCVACKNKNGTFVFTRSLYAGKVLADMQLTTHPMLVTIRPRSCAATDERVWQQTEKYAITLTEPRVMAEILPGSQHGRLDVTEAQIVVSGGRGMQGPDNWHILEALVDALGPRATLACSRPVSDDGWRPHGEHVGQTGRTISPDLYIACGISGAIQHVAGIIGSGCIVAINRDPGAPIFKVSDYGIVGDLFEVVPALTSAILAMKRG